MDSNPMFNAILKWSLSQQDPEPNRDIKPLSDDDKAFLDRAMKSMMINETERMKIISAIIAMPEEGAELIRVASSGDAHPTALFNEFSDLTGGTLAAAKKAAAAAVTDAKAAEIKSSLATPPVTTNTSSSPATPPPVASASSSGNGPVAVTMDSKSLAALVLRKKEEALDELEDRVMKIDNATDLHKVGGLVPLIRNISSSYPSLRWRAANVLGTVVQNNPTAQQWALDHGAMTTLLSSIVNTSTEISLPSHHPDLPKVLAKCMFALSCLIRQFPPSEQAFLRAAGLARLTKLLSNDAAPTDVRRKALTLLHYFFTEDRAHRATGRTLGLIPVIVRLIGHATDVDIRETAPRALWALCSGEQLPLVASQLSRANVAGVINGRLAAIAALSADEREAAEREQRGLERLLKWLQTSPEAIASTTAATATPAAAAPATR